MNASDLSALAQQLAPIDPLPPISAEVAFVGRLQVAELLLARCLEDAKALGYGSHVLGSITDAKASTRFAWRCVMAEA